MTEISSCIPDDFSHFNKSKGEIIKSDQGISEGGLSTSRVNDVRAGES